MFTISFSATVCALPLLLLLKEGSLTSIIAVRIAFVVIGVAFFAPFHAWAQNLVPAHARYAVISLGYALGSQLLGSPTAVFSLWCFQKTGMITSVGWYWMLLGLASSFSILLARKHSEVME